jgi:ribosomal protein S18 acetylase RimI-like enzyme
MFALHYVPPARLIVDGDDCVKARERSVVSCLRALAIVNAVFLSMDHEIRPLTHQDEPILWEMLYYGLSSAGKDKLPTRDVVRRPEISRYVEGWGRVGDTGFVAHDKKNRALLGAAWLRRPTDKSDALPELALAVKPEHRRRGIGTALLTQLVRANPDHSTISVSFVAGKPVLRLYERFGFKVVEQRPDAVVMHRAT